MVNSHLGGKEKCTVCLTVPKCNLSKNNYRTHNKEINKQKNSIDDSQD